MFVDCVCVNVPWRCQHTFCASGSSWVDPDRHQGRKAPGPQTGGPIYRTHELWKREFVPHTIFLCLCVMYFHDDSAYFSKIQIKSITYYMVLDTVMRGFLFYTTQLRILVQSCVKNNTVRVLHTKSLCYKDSTCCVTINSTCDVPYIY